MNAITLPRELPWASSREEERRFRRLVLICSAILLVLSAIMAYLPLPERPKQQVTEIPPRLAQLLLERKQQPPPPPKVAKVEPKKVEPPKKKETVKKKTEPKKQEPPKKKEPPKQTKEAARKKAASSGILAFADQLADLRDDTSLNSLSRTEKLTKSNGANTTAKKVEAPKRSVITSAAAATGSGGIDTAALSTDTGGTSLQSRSTSQVAAPTSTTSRSRDSGSGKIKVSARSLEEIQEVIDRNKGALFRIYNRALRKDPTLEGKVVLSLTIDPSGAVTACLVVSSELGSPSLENKLVSRIKLINFGARDVEPVTTTLPIDFFPA